MREIIHFLAGQFGNQIREKFWEMNTTMSGCVKLHTAVEKFNNISRDAVITAVLTVSDVEEGHKGPQSRTSFSCHVNGVDTIEAYQEYAECALGLFSWRWPVGCYLCVALMFVCICFTFRLTSYSSKMFRVSSRSRNWGNCIGLLWILIQVQWCCVNSLSTQGGCHGNLPASEYSALQSLYNSTHGADWKWKGGQGSNSVWSFTGNLAAPCTVPWQGLVCVPASASNECFIEQLNLQNYNLVGSLPSQISQLSSLEILNLALNHLSGNLPSEVWGLTALTQLILNSNMLTGSLPSEVGELAAVQYLSLSSNMFTGSLPSEVRELAAVLVLRLDYNMFTGSLPSEVGRLTPIQLLVFNFNILTGSLPSEMGELSSMLKLYLNSNSFTGSLPTELWSLPALQELFLFSNMFTGSLPTEVGELASVQYLYLYSNMFTGSLPSQLGSLMALQRLLVEDNAMTGTLPLELSQLKTFEYLYASNNLFSGSILFNEEQWPSLSFANLSSNYFSGNLNIHSALPLLQVFDVSYNLLSGSFSVPGCPMLIYLNISLNIFDGKFGLNGSAPSLQVVDASQNHLSGPVPSSLFLVGNLTTALLYSNCFTGSLPPSMCSASRLEVLVLDDISSSASCLIKLPSFLKVTIPMNPIQGGIPKCLWQLPLLRVFHASGNGLQGGLGELNATHSSLTDVSVANNRLSGELPLSWQRSGRITRLDVSSNHLTGVLSPDFNVSGSSNSTIRMDVNRLSGAIPRSLVTTSAVVDMLDGNLFECDGSNSLPQTDPFSRSYECGSSSFDYASIAWLVSLGVAGICCVCFQSQLQQLWYRFNDIELYLMSLEKPLVNSLHVMGVLWSFNGIFGLLGALGVCVAMVSYILLKSTTGSTAWSTYSIQYLWATSVVYLHGMLPTVLVLLYVLSFIGISTWQLRPYLSSRVSPSMHQGEGTLLNYLLLAALLCAHIMVTLILNGVYVLTTVQNDSSSDMVLIQVSVGLFKLAWNKIFLSSALSQVSMSARVELLSSAFAMLFTFIISPVLATFFEDSSCFSHLITGEAAVASSGFEVPNYECAYALVLGFTCSFDSLVIKSTSVNPSWFYSNQCSSELVVNYAPVLMYSYLTSGIVLPAVKVVANHLNPDSLAYWIPGPLMRWLLVGWEPRQPSSSCVGKFCSSFGLGNSELPVVSETPAIEDGSSVNKNPVPSTVVINSNSNVNSKVQIPEALSAARLIDKMLLNVTVMTTFGLACPLLLLCVVLDSMSTMCIYRLELRWFLQRKVSAGVLAEAFEAVEKATEATRVGYRSVMLMTVVVIGAFWALFVYDMMADVYGSFIGGLTVLIPTISGLLLFGALSIHVPHAVVRQFTVGIELQSMSNPVVEDQSMSNPVLEDQLELNHRSL